MHLISEHALNDIYSCWCKKLLLWDVVLRLHSYPSLSVASNHHRTETGLASDLF